MIKYSLLVFFAALIISFFSAQHQNTQLAEAQDLQTIQLKKLNAPGCMPDDFFLAITDDIDVPLFPGRGRHTMNIRPANKEAKAYFDQGMNMFYGFHFIEARASFKKAQQLDPSFAMAYWGEALTYGPNINNSSYKLRPHTLDLLQSAALYKEKADPLSRALIDAQIKRYQLDTALGNPKINTEYADLMKAVYESFPNDQDAGALYADALMQLHPWDLYDNVGNPKSWTADIEGEITKLTKRFSDHPGLNHYYIHCVEASNTAYRGLESAKKMSVLAPGLAHMLHMSSHIYARTGNYKEGVQSNADARNAYANYKTLYPDVQAYKILYYSHSLAMEFANAIMLSDYKSSLNLALLNRALAAEKFQSNESLSNDDQLKYAAAFLTWTRYEKWDSLTTLHDVSIKYPYIRMLLAFSKGMAFAAKKELMPAEKELQLIQSLINDPSLKEHSEFTNAPEISGRIASHILKGEILKLNHQYDVAINEFKHATEEEDKMIYNEPKDWLLPARYYYAKALLAADRKKEARAVLQRDLLLNPKNYWSKKLLSGIKG